MSEEDKTRNNPQRTTVWPNRNDPAVRIIPQNYLEAAARRIVAAARSQHTVIIKPQDDSQRAN
jgi:hypothetical protein